MPTPSARMRAASPPTVLSAPAQLLLLAAIVTAQLALAPAVQDVVIGREGRHITDNTWWSFHPRLRGARATTLQRHSDGETRWCYYSGERYSDGEHVQTSEPCLRCKCARGTLVCYMRVCSALPDPPPRSCLLHHARGACCPTLRCPEGVNGGGSDGGGGGGGGVAARLGDEDIDVTFPALFGGGCVQRGTLYAEGSAMSSSSACEHCFCIGGRQRCVRPSCLPPPPGCEPVQSSTTSSDCCPSRYRCTHHRHITHSPAHQAESGCVVAGRRYPDGERVPGAGASSCDNCFCLRGLVRCLASTCAPALLGCKPLLRPGECCPHSYDCRASRPDGEREQIELFSVTDNFLTSIKNEDRSFHGDVNIISQATKPISNFPPIAARLRQTTELPKKNKTTAKKSHLDTTAENQTSTMQNSEHTTRPASAHAISTGNHITTQPTQDVTTADSRGATQTTAQEPDEIMRIVINGTINCTAELSTSALPVDDNKAEDRTDTEIESYTFNPNDLITEGPGSDTFTVNVSTLLRTNMSAGALPPVAAIPADLEALLNMSKKKEDYDYDYGDATLPPSLPNLKIIPFVAADAVVEGAPVDAPPDLSYTPLALDRSDKFPAYLPSSTGSDEGHLQNYGEDIRYGQHIESLSSLLLGGSDAPTRAPQREDHYALVTSRSEFDAPDDENARPPHFVVGSHAANLFSPPVQTEGGFLPKEPPILDGYYAASFPQSNSDHVHATQPTPPPINIAHHAPSINFDKHKECISSEGVRVAPGESVEGVGIGGDKSSCSSCVCTWGVLLCSEPTCASPPPDCKLIPPTETQCCPIVCDETQNPESTTTSIEKSSTSTSPIPPTTNIIFEPYSNSSDNLVSEQTPKKDSTIDTLPTTTPVYRVSTYSQPSQNPHQNRTDRPSQPASATEIRTISTVAPIRNISIHHTTVISEMSRNLSTSTSAPLQESTDYEETEEHQTDEENSEEEDDGFSFGNVLKLLLSDGYDTTTKSYRRTTTTSKTTATRKPIATTVHYRLPTISAKTTTTTTRKPITTAVTSPSKTLRPFRPLTTRPVNMISMRPFQLATASAESIKKSDHLVLGEVSAIERSPATIRPVVSPVRTTTAIITPKPTLASIEDNVIRDVEPSPSGGFGGGMLKLAGCNIYGRMYRVGRIISELSNACLQCMCTEVGVQCHPLTC